MYIILSVTLFDLHLVLLPNATEAPRVKQKIEFLIEHSTHILHHNSNIPNVVSLLHLAVKFSSEFWCLPDANGSQKSLNFEIKRHLNDVELKIQHNLEIHQEEKMKYVKTLSNENKIYINSRAHSYGIKMISKLLEIGDHSLFMKYNEWQNQIINCFLINGYTCVPSRFIPTVKLFIQIISSETLTIKGLNVVFEKLYLFILNSKFSTPQQKQLTLEMIMKLTEEKKTIIRIFKLFDCSVSSFNVIKSMLVTLRDIVLNKLIFNMMKNLFRNNLILIIK